jgi:sorbitol/mannitol transport system substrate-binding protein
VSLFGSSRSFRRAVGVAACLALVGGLTSCSADNSINVLMVSNPHMVDLERLTAEYFTPETGIKVNFTALPENEVRQQISREFSQQSGNYDVASISNFEAPFYAKNGWLSQLDGDIAQDVDFNQDDVLPSIRQSLTGPDGKVYAEPFYGESSFLMYRKDVLAALHLTMPPHPTWLQVADLASKVDRAVPDMRGICLRGQPGWGELIAPLTTVVNTFGGTWFTKDWQPQVNSPEFKNATNFYVNLVRDHGEIGAAYAGFTECLQYMLQGKVAMWYDATSGASQLEKIGSPVRGDIGYVPAPVELTANSQWLYTWAWGIEKASSKQEAAWKFISWASSQKYENLVGSELGYEQVPPGTRTSLYSNYNFNVVNHAFANQEEQAIATADPNNPGVQPRPTIGIQLVDIPEFSQLGDQISQGISAAIAGNASVDDVLNNGQALAERIATKYRQGNR